MPRKRHLLLLLEGTLLSRDAACELGLPSAGAHEDPGGSWSRSPAGFLGGSGKGKVPQSTHFYPRLHRAAAAAAAAAAVNDVI